MSSTLSIETAENILPSGRRGRRPIHASPFKGRWPRSCAAGGVAGRMHRTNRALISRPLSRLRRQLPLKGAPRNAYRTTPHRYPRRVYTLRSGREANPRSAMQKTVVTFRDTNFSQAFSRFATGSNARQAPKRFSFRESEDAFFWRIQKKAPSGYSVTSCTLSGKIFAAGCKLDTSRM